VCRNLRSPRNCVRPVLALFVLSILVASPSMAQSPTVVVSSANLTIDRTVTDSYSISGSFGGVSLQGAQAIIFGIGQFGAALPLSAFAHQSGTSLYQYQDTTGLRPYWLSGLTVDLDKNVFSAVTNAIVLNGLGNPFAVRLGTDVASACGIVRVQERSAAGSATETYGLTPGDPPTQPCAISAAPVAEPPTATINTETQVTVSMSGSGLDANSAELFVADGNAQPSGKALCTLAAGSNGTFSCTASFNQPAVGVVALLVQATVKGQPVLAPGFFIQAVAPASDDAIQQQITAVQNSLRAGYTAYAKYGDSVAARVQVMAALRQKMPAQAGLTGQPVNLSPLGSELTIITASGIPVVYNISNPDAPSSTGSSVQDGNLSAAVVRTSGNGDLGTVPPLPPKDQPQQCGDFTRQIVANDNVLVWDPGAMFFPGAQVAPTIAAVLKASTCPSFNVNTQFKGPAATVGSVAEFHNYGTVIMNTHGNVDAYGRPFFVSGEVSPSKMRYIGLPGQNVPWGVFCFREVTLSPPPEPDTFLPTLTEQPDCYYTVYPNNPYLQVSPNTIVYGGFCDGYSGYLGGSGAGWRPLITPAIPTLEWVNVFARGANNAYFGYRSSINTDQDKAGGTAIFESLVNSYSNVIEAQQAVNDPQLVVSDNGQNLAYVGNPHLVLTSISPSIPGSQVLAATLEGTENCSGETSSSTLLNVKWTNPVTAGHLTSVADLVSGSQDNFTNGADCEEATGGCDTNDIPPPLPPLIWGWALAQYTPDASLGGNGDNITADFLPNPTSAAVSRGCLAVQANVGLFVESQLATVYNAVTTNFSPISTTFSPPIKVSGSYPPVKYEGTLPGTANITVAPFGGNSFQVVVTVGGGYPYDGYASIDLSAHNPGPAGKATVQVVGMWNLTTQGELASCAADTECNFPDGVVLINTGSSATYQLATQGVVPFMGEFNSSSGPVDIYIGINADDVLTTSSNFTLTLDIYFNQDQ
jgi:hypothetical protein